MFGRRLGRSNIVVSAMGLGPLSPEQMAQVDEILGR